jgi:hypothetical protein
LATKADQVRVFYDAENQPVKGIQSYRHQAGIEPGFFTQLSGVRLDRWAIRVKDGDVKLTSGAILGSSTFRGAGTLLPGMVSTSNPALYAAFHLTNVGRIYRSTDGITFSEISQASGAFGNTRFITSTSHDPWFYMQGVNHRFIPNEYYGVAADNSLIIQHHGNAPRIANSQLSAGILAIHDEIAVPQDTTTFVSIPTFPAFLLVNTTAETTHTSTGGGTIVGSDQGTTPNNYIRIRATNPVQNELAEVDFGTAMSLGTSGTLSSRQLVMLVESPTPNIIEKYAILLDDGGAGSPVTVYDPTSTTKNQAPTITPADGGGKLYWVAYSLDTIDGTTAAGGGIDLNVVDRVQFKWAVAGETATYDLFVYVIAGSGKVPGGSKHVVSYVRANSFCESKAMEIVTVKPELIANLGGATAISGRITGGMRIPSLDARIHVNYKLHYQNPTQAELEKGTDLMAIYRKDVVFDPDQGRWFYERDYSLIDQFEAIGAYNAGAWTFTTGGALGIRTVTDSAFTKHLQFRAPTKDTLPIPQGKAMEFTGGRLFVGARTTDNIAYSTLWISDEGHPGRFRHSTKVLPNGQFDPKSGTTHQFEDEDIMAIKATATRYQGVANVFVFTSKSVWLVGRDVNRIERVATIGTLSPMSVVEYEGAFYFLSADRRWIKLIPGQPYEDIGHDVQDKLNSIPGASDVAASRLYRVSGGASNWRVYLAYGVTGSTNPRVLVYNILTRTIEADDRPTDPFTVEQFIPWVKSGVKGLYAFSSDREFYEYEQPSSTANAAVTLTTGEFSFVKGNRMAVKRTYISCEDMASVTATAAVSYYKGSGTNRTATLSLDVTDDRLRKWFGTWSSTGDRIGTSAKLSYTATMPGGKFLFGLGAELADRGHGTGS